jgi:hypothetical protein
MMRASGSSVARCWRKPASASRAHRRSAGRASTQPLPLTRDAAAQGQCLPSAEGSRSARGTVRVAHTPAGAGCSSATPCTRSRGTSARRNSPSWRGTACLPQSGRKRPADSCWVGKSRCSRPCWCNSRSCSRRCNSLLGLYTLAACRKRHQFPPGRWDRHSPRSDRPCPASIHCPGSIRRDADTCRGNTGARHLHTHYPCSTGCSGYRRRCMAADPQRTLRIAAAARLRRASSFSSSSCAWPQPRPGRVRRAGPQG